MLTQKIQILTEYIDIGFSIIPVNADKKPLIKWSEYQQTRPTLEQVLQWNQQFNEPNWAVVTGKISNVFIVDTDNQDALIAAESLGLTNSCSVKTPHGRHFYFNFPDDGKVRKTISGHGSNGTYWPSIVGLDARSEGGYALLPPSKGYEWEIDEFDIRDEMTDYVDWDGAVFEEPANPQPQLQPQPPSKFSNLDLTDTSTEGAGKTKNLTREKFKELVAQLPDGKIPRGGSGIHDATYKFLAEEALFVGLGNELEAAGREFMETYFSAPLTDGRFETSLGNIRKKEQQNHPERFDSNGNYIYHINAQKRATTSINSQPINLLNNNQHARKEELANVMNSADVAKLADTKQEFWQIPWLPKESIVQVHGYSGHGKSLFLQHAIHHLACGTSFGPFEHGGEIPTKILYLDYENGKSTLGRRVIKMNESFGTPSDQLSYWAPWNEIENMNLMDSNGIALLLTKLKILEPQILIIDTLRSAYPGLKENTAEDWSKINELAIKIRNAGCSVIMVHHSNKPDKEGLGREAGSSNQLTTLETQVRVTQVCEDSNVANSRGAIWANDLPNNPFIYMKKQAQGAILDMVMEIQFGKVREWSDYHDPLQYIGIAKKHDGTSFICHSDSPKTRLCKLIRSGKYNRDYITGKMNRDASVLAAWAKDNGLTLPRS